MYKFSKLGGCDSIIKAATAEDLRPTAMATVAEGFICNFLRFFPKWRPKCVFHYTSETLN